MHPTTKHVYADPVTSCTSSHPSCAGQSLQLKQSACSAITCCQVGDTWSIYPSVDACKDAQAAKKQTAYPPCLVYGKTFHVSPETCRYYQDEEAKMEAISKEFNSMGSSPMPDQPPITNTIPIKSNAQYRSECVQQIQANYDFLIEKYNNMGEMYKGYVGSLTQQRDSQIGDCMIRFPTYQD